MPLRKQDLRTLVQERLVVAAEEIFVLFERAFAEYEAELRVLRTDLQRKSSDIREEEIQTFTVGDSSDVHEEQVRVKQEEDEPFQIPLPSLKSEQTGDTSGDETGASPKGEEPGHSQNGRVPHCSSDNNGSNDWEFVHKRRTDVSGAEGNDMTWENSVSSATAASNEEQLFTCEQCFKTFKTPQILKGHQKTHALQGTFPCQVCNKVYSHRNTYNQHLRLHSEQNPYSCSICDRRFTQKGHFVEHLRIHTGEKPFSCSDCGMKFRLRNIRDRHVLRLHGGPRPHTCPVCHKGFVSKCYYTDHMRTHTGERPFTCNLCDKSYLSKESLKKHMKLHESDGEIRVAVLE